MNGWSSTTKAVTRTIQKARLSDGASSPLLSTFPKQLIPWDFCAYTEGPGSRAPEHAFFHAGKCQRQTDDGEGIHPKFMAPSNQCRNCTVLPPISCREKNNACKVGNAGNMVFLSILQSVIAVIYHTSIHAFGPFRQLQTLFCDLLAVQTCMLSFFIFTLFGHEQQMLFYF